MGTYAETGQKSSWLQPLPVLLVGAMKSVLVPYYEPTSDLGNLAHSISGIGGGGQEVGSGGYGASLEGVG